MFLKCFGDGNSSGTARGYPTVIEELCRPFSWADIKKATNNFHQYRLIELGGFGEVYKGYFRHNDASHYEVAVKRLYVKYSIEKEEELFKNEIELLSQLRHPNIISLIGFCNHKDEHIVVYEYMSNRSLDIQLQGGELSWKERLEICIGAARGLHYLHAGLKRTIIHRHITSSNILLDHSMHPKLTDFSLSVKGAHFMSKPKPIEVKAGDNPLGYMVPDNLSTGIVTDKSDVYSFGIVLLEVVCKRRIFDIVREPRDFLEKPVEENIDPNIIGKIAPECWQVFADIMVRCLEYEPDERPTMGEVEVELERALSLQEQQDIANTNGPYTLISTTIIPLDDRFYI
ncbi:receptor-like protein kinase FERONIA [Cajanus cajan]|uniref:Receptor-like protein kinase FERONIA n=1 Tax=Cajanus cajan TaxID=3821 RepID=A0A151R3P2_CAJCA|nr:receptor-like protein kinase FERONIA [Cajanus cajan]KYP37156.1 Receptor-like protein kinase FERONIA [Cajanus cajan]